MDARTVDRQPARAVLVAVREQDAMAGQAGTDLSLCELRRLAEARALCVVGIVVQTCARPDPAAYVSRGKAGELAVAANVTEADVVVADDDLTPRQTRALEESARLPVVDRSALIRDIVTRHPRRGGDTGLRTGGGLPSVVITGYTNTGKSALLNRLCGARARTRDVPFTTLDPTVRQVTADDSRFTVTDTAGFIRRFRHRDADFESTFDALRHGDLILHVVDASAPDVLGQITSVHDVLHRTGTSRTPELLVLNKIDIARQDRLAALRRTYPDPLAVSALTGEGIPELLLTVATRLRQLELVTARA